MQGAGSMNNKHMGPDLVDEFVAHLSHSSGMDDRHAAISLRDYFAAHAPAPFKGWGGGELEWRWHYADAMLAEREK